MKTVEITVQRADKLAQQLYGFVYLPELHALILETYRYEERLTWRHKWVVCQQWIRAAQGIFTGGITLKGIPITPAVLDAAKRKFIKDMKVLKEEPRED